LRNNLSADYADYADYLYIYMALGVLLVFAYNFCEVGLFLFFATEEKEEKKGIREKI